jgi:ATP-binding cassette subfamily B protein
VFFVLITVQVLVIFGVLLTLHVPLALLTFALAVPVLVLCSRFEREYHTVVRRIQDETGDLTTSIEEGARGIRVLKAFGRWRESYEAYAARCQEIHDSQIERIRVHTKFVWLLGVVPNLTLTAVLLAGVLAVGSGGLTLGGLVAFVSYVLLLVFPLELLAWIMALAGEAESAAGRVYEVFDTEPAVRDRPGARELTDVRGAIRLEGVGFRYPGGERAALEAVDLDVGPARRSPWSARRGAGRRPSSPC